MSKRNAIAANALHAHQLARREAGDQLACYDFISNLNRFRHRQSGDLLTEGTLLRLHGRELPRHMRVDEALYTPALGVRQYAGLAFEPGQPVDIVSQNLVRLNIWLKPSIERRQGDARLFLELVALVFDHNEEAINFFLDAVASLLQKPGTKWAFLVLLIGPQGIGKSLLCEMISELVGRGNTAFPTVDAIKSPFTGWLAGAYLVICHELDRMTREVATRLKHWVTSEQLLINAKNIPEYYIKSYVNVIICSNDDDIAHLDADDRRYFVWISRAKKQAPAYYATVWQWFFHGEGKSVVFDHLLGRNLANFNPNVAPPRTQGRDRLVVYSQSEVERELQDALQFREHPLRDDLVTVREIRYFLEDQNIRCNDNDILRFLHRIGGLALGQHRIRGQRVSLWAIRETAQWQTATARELANSYRSLAEQFDHESDGDQI